MKISFSRSIFSGHRALILAFVVCGAAASGQGQSDNAKSDNSHSDNGRNVLFTEKDFSLEYDVDQFVTTPQGPVPFLGHGVQVGTAEGAVQGSTIVAFTFVGPVATSRVAITDNDGDRILFKKVSVGTFLPPIDDTTTNDPHLKVFIGPDLVLAGTYEVLVSTGKYTKRFRPGSKFPFRSVTSAPATTQQGGPATPPSVGQIPTGTEYVEVFTN